MNSNLLVSVLMVTYNQEKYVVTAIESVLASTYRDFELIIVDDRSKDKTFEIAKSYEMKDTRVRVYLNENNFGDYPNRNKAASYAKGKYLKYVDGDDLIYPWGLALLVKMMEQFPEAGWGLCSLIQNESRPYPFILTPKQAYEYEYFGPGIFHKAPLSSIIKKEIFDEVGGFEHVRMAGDFEMWNKLAQKYPLLLMSDGIVWHREHAQQESKVLTKNMFIFYGAYEKYRIQYLKHINCPLDEKKVKAAIKKIKKKALKYLIMSILFLNKNLFIISFIKIKVYYAWKD